MKTIIVATDFSAAAENAANYTADMAVSIGAHVLLLHISDLPISYVDMPVTAIPSNALEEASELLLQQKERILHHTGGKASVETMARMGIFFTELKTVCESIEPYAIAFGCQGTTAAQRFIWGGHTVYAMQHLPWPVLAVPPNIKYTGIQKIGLACDFVKVVPHTPAHKIKALVKEFNASLHVLNTDAKETFSPSLVFESGMLQEMLETVKPFYHFIASERVDEGINAFAAANSLDLLIVLPKRHSFFDKLLHESHTKQLALHSQIPVLSLHEGS
jgi:nucleotide-binding universal stress UspA family protein